MLSTRVGRVLVLLNFLLMAPSSASATPIVFSDFGIDAASILIPSMLFEAPSAESITAMRPGRSARDGEKSIGMGAELQRRC
jgi:hypothetical protein